MSRIDKSFSLPENIDPNHKYAYRSGDFGMFTYWYVDAFGNYWEYTNAPTDSDDFDPTCGEATFVDDQVTPETAPQFYNPAGKKYHAAVDQGAQVQFNPQYSPYDREDVWYGLYQDAQGAPRFLYLEDDVRKNPDLWFQYNLRLLDSGLPSYRKYAARLFASNQVKDQAVGTALILIDQGAYTLDEVCNLKVGDVEFIDRTVRLLGRKFVCDTDFLDAMVGFTTGRPSEEPLLKFTTMYGDEPLTPEYLGALFLAMRISPKYMFYWKVASTLSNIVHRLVSSGKVSEGLEAEAYDELARTFCTSTDIRFYVDFKIHHRLFGNIEALIAEVDQFDAQEAQSAQDEPPVDEEMVEGTEESVEEDLGKSLVRLQSDNLGVLSIFSNLENYLKYESLYSQWLHREPLHDMSKEQEEALILELQRQSMPEEDETDE